MRLPIIAILLVAGAIAATANSAAADLYSGRTVVYYERSHGTQVEYYSPTGGAHLWYPGNRRSLAGRWKIDGSGKGARICFQYGANTYNPVTGHVGGGWECSSEIRHRSIIKSSCVGDKFSLASGSIPFRMTGGAGNLAVVSGICGGK